MHSASRLTCADSPTGPAISLFAALNELLRAVEGRVILLRPLTDSFDSQRDDIDLLLTETQRQQLLRAAFVQCIRAQTHCRIRQSSPAKAQLILWTIDCSQKLIVDLWTSFDQLPKHRRSCIPAERLLNTLTLSVSEVQVRTTNTDHAVEEAVNPFLHFGENRNIPALQQLSPDIDLCLLIQHLATKRRRLTTVARRERIVRACERLRAWSPIPTLPHSLLADLREVAEQLPRAIVVTPKFVALSEDYLLQRIASVPQNRGLPVLERRPRRGLMTEFRKAVLERRPIVAVIGSDGAGKSSLVSAFAIQQPNAATAVAKKYYRRSWAYQLTSGLMKRLCGIDRGEFDDHISPLITLRSAAASWIQMCLPFGPWSGKLPSVIDTNNLPPGDSRNKLPRVTIQDRSFASFLITDRKSDSPQLTRGATWIESITPPVTSVLLTLPYASLARRKQELSPTGHEIYQRMLFEQTLRQRPVELMLLASLPSAIAAATAISRMLQTGPKSVQESKVVSDNEKAVA